MKHLLTLIAVGMLSLTLHAQTIPTDHFDGGKNLTQGSKNGSAGTLSEILRGQEVTNAAKQDAAKLVLYTSAASAGGAATEALTVTGLGVSDTILAVHQSTKGANNLPLLSWSTQANNSLTAIWSANPGAGAVIKVYVKKP